VEASALQVQVRLPRGRTAIGASLLRLRSDDQLVALFREGDEDAFCVIHDRYRQRLFAYTRQMLPGARQDAEDALQDVFVRAYSGLRATNRDLALRPWLYRVAHNRCIDVLRRPPAPAPELFEMARSSVLDPIDEAERRDSLRRLIRDVRRLPEQQRSALLMRELSGMSYAELATALGVSIPAVKSLLVRARVSLAQSIVARDTACSQIRNELTLAHDRGVRPNATSRRHLQDCAPCREFRHELRGHSRQLGALVPALGPAGVLANVFGIGGGTSGGAAATGLLGGGSGVVAAGGVLASGAGHVVTLLAAAAVAAGGAVEIQHTVAGQTGPTTQSAPSTSLGASSSRPVVPLATAVQNAAVAPLSSYSTSVPKMRIVAPTPTPPAESSGNSAGTSSAPMRLPVIPTVVIPLPGVSPSEGGSATTPATSTTAAASSSAPASPTSGTTDSSTSSAPASTNSTGSPASGTGSAASGSTSSTPSSATASATPTTPPSSTGSSSPASSTSPAGTGATPATAAASPISPAPTGTS
jgi:RNA polymerase sigma factor (sigma-70 family)